MNKDLKKELKKVSNEIAEIPVILPSFNPANKQDYVNKMADKVLSGELTYYDVGRELQLTNNQIEYCKFFSAGETMGNGTQSAMLAYQYDPANKMERQQAANWACNFNKPTHPCSTLIQIMLNGEGLNDNNLDMHLKFVCEQNYDLKAKVLAIREANTLKGRNNKKVIEVNVSHKLDYSTLPKKELQKLIEIARKAKIKDDESD
jgi:hypothetical protein